jgi:F-type H+-transporting ATPase subunit b
MSKEAVSYALALTHASTDDINYYSSRHHIAHREPLPGSGKRRGCQPGVQATQFDAIHFSPIMRELFFQVVPIVLILLVFYGILKVLFFQPLLKVIAEREARTLGAQKEAEAAQRAAEEKIKQYHDALKQARSEVYVEQEAARKKVLDERAVQLKEARAKAAAFVEAGRKKMAGELDTARREVEGTINALAAVVARRVLQSTRPPGAPPREMQ